MNYNSKRLKLGDHYYLVSWRAWERLQAYEESDMFEEDLDWRDYEAILEEIKDSEPCDHLTLQDMSRMMIKP